MVRACTGEVCVRSTRPEVVSASDNPLAVRAAATQNVSISPRAGWSAEMFNASKLAHSSSTSGPSASS
jgi:hypothetical protein